MVGGLNCPRRKDLRYDPKVFGWTLFWVVRSGGQNDDVNRLPARGLNLRTPTHPPRPSGVILANNIPKWARFQKERDLGIWGFSNGQRPPNGKRDESYFASPDRSSMTSSPPIEIVLICLASRSIFRRSTMRMRLLANVRKSRRAGRCARSSQRLPLGVELAEAVAIRSRATPQRSNDPSDEHEQEHERERRSRSGRSARSA